MALLNPTDEDTRDSLRRMSRDEIMRKYDVRTRDRKGFLRDWKTEHRGQKPHHRTQLGPTHRGKTTTELQILNEVITPDCQAIILSAKPAQRDPVMSKAAEQLNLVVVQEWPPSRAQQRYHRMRDKRGYVVRPEQNLRDHAWTTRNIRSNFQAAMTDAYATSPKAPRIIVADEAHKVYNTYDLKAEYEAPLMSGLPDCSESSLIQRGRFMTYLAYDAPEDVIIYNDPDLSNQRRYSEIGGVDPYVILAITSGLKTYETKDGHTISEFLHIRRAGPRLTVVGIT